MYSRMAFFARAYALSFFRLQNARITANSLRPKAVTTRCVKNHRPGPGFCHAT